MKIFTYTIFGIVALAIVAGFFVLGTPKEERLRRFDEIRVGHLQEIQWQVINYWQAKGKMPESLDALINETQGTRPPLDPETSVAYEYRIIETQKLTFELCANFKTQSSEGKTSGPRIYGPIDDPATWNWQHGVGRVCFERTIDPKLYRPISEKAID